MDPSFGPEGGRLQDVVFCTAASGEAMSGSQCQGGNVKEAMSGRFILRVYTIRHIITYKLRLARETIIL